MIKHMMMAAAIVAFSAPALADRTTSPQQAAATPDSTSLPQQQADAATTPDSLASNQITAPPNAATPTGRKNAMAPDDPVQSSTPHKQTAADAGATGPSQ